MRPGAGRAGWAWQPCPLQVVGERGEGSPVQRALVRGAPRTGGGRLRDVAAIVSAARGIGRGQAARLLRR